MNNKILFRTFPAIFLFLLLAVSSCQKEDFTLPTDVSIIFGSDTDRALNGELLFTGSGLQVDVVRLIGERTISSSIDFEKISPFNVPPDLFNNTPSLVKVNVPQGIYDRFDLQLFIGKGKGNYSEFNDLIEDWLDDLEDLGDDGDDDPDDDDIFELQQNLGALVNLYRNEIDPGIRIEGTMLLNGLPHTLILAIDDAFSFHLPVLNSSGTRELSFEAEKLNEIRVDFDPEFWFSPLSEQILRNSWIGIYRGENLLFIHKKVNPQLYTILLSRLDDSFKSYKTR